MSHNSGHTGFVSSLERSRDRVAKMLLRAHVSADAMSMAGVLVCACAGVLAWQWHAAIPAAILFLCGAGCDLLDGAIARAAPPRSGYNNGPMVDCICDKAGELAFIGGLSLGSGDSATLRVLGLAAALGLLTAYIKAASAECGLRLHWREVRVVGRTGRVLILGVGLLIASSAGQGFDAAALTVGVALCIFNACTLTLRVLKVVHTGGMPQLRQYTPKR